MRARYPDIEAAIERAGARIGYEIYENEGRPTVLLMPTWTIIHSRFWKMQVPYLARHYRVITFDGPGNGRSDRVTDPNRYSADEYAADAIEVLDATGARSAVVVGLSLGAAYSVRLARRAPERVDGIVMIGPSIPLTPPAPERETISQTFEEPYPDDVKGWGKYNLAYWQDHYADFCDFFFDQCLPEPHSTKPHQDTCAWAAETSGAILAAESAAPEPDEDWREAVAAVGCPVLVIHGTRDAISPHARGVEAARLSSGSLLTMVGSGHLPQTRDPVRVNLAIREFVDEVAA